MSVAVIAADDGLFTKSYGFANVELSTPATSDAVYEIASLTKPFTVIGVMMLVEAGRVALDDRVSRYLPKSPTNWADITVRHLLTNPRSARVNELRTTRANRNRFVGSPDPR
jgi:CubicO group peptidase (beta-lactamase class C family)